MDWEESKFSSMQWAEGVWGDRWCAAAMLWTETVWTGSLTWKESLAGLRGAIGLSVLQKCMVDGSGLGVNSTGVWKREGGVEEVVRECVCVCVCVCVWTILQGHCVVSLCSWLSGNTSIYIALALLKITLRLWIRAWYMWSIHSYPTNAIVALEKKTQDISDNYQNYGINRDLALKNAQARLHWKTER